MTKSPKMKILSVLIFFTAVNSCLGGTLRVSKVADKEAENTEQMKLPDEVKTQVLFVEKASLLSDADVKRAVPNYGLDNVFYIELTNDGARKLKEATENTIYGRDRLAIVIGGRLISAPVLQAPLGSELVISNLGNPQEVDDLARKMSGRPPRPEGVELPDPNPKAADGGKEPPILRVIYPPMDLQADTFDIVAFVEGIKIADPKGGVNVRDLGGLISTTLLLTKASKVNSVPKPTIAAGCDFIKALAHNFPEVAPLAKTRNTGRISVESLSDVMSPYINGDKSWPVKSQKANKP
jgi:hypothetical protein